MSEFMTRWHQCGGTMSNELLFYIIVTDVLNAHHPFNVCQAVFFKALTNRMRCTTARPPYQQCFQSVPQLKEQIYNSCMKEIEFLVHTKLHEFA